MCSTTPRTAHTVDDLWDRLSAVRKHLTPRRQTDLSKRDVEFLLEYRTKMESSRDDLTRCTGELDSIRRMLHAMNGGDNSLQDLIKLSSPSSEVASKVFYNFVLLKVLKSAVKDGSEKIPNFSTTATSKDVKSMPMFYRIVKDGVKKKDHAFDKEIERAAKLCIWLKAQLDKPKRKKTLCGERKDSHGTITRTELLGVPKATPSTPPVTKAPQHASAAGVSSNLLYQCHFLLNKHPASSSITSAEYKKLSNLEDKLRYLLDELHSLKTVEEPRAPLKTSPKVSPKTSVALQVDMSPSTIKKERCSQTSPQPEAKGDVQASLERSASQSDEGEVFLTNSQSRETSKLMVGHHCITCKRQYSKLSTDELTNSLSSSILSGKLNVDRQTSLSSLQRDDMMESEDSLPPLTVEDLKDLKAVNNLYSELVREKTTASSHEKVLKRRRRQSAPILRSACASVREEHVTTLEHLPYPPGSYREMQSRAVSARIYSPDKKRTVRLKNADTQTENIVDPREAPADVLFADDEAEGPNQTSYLPYGRFPGHTDQGMNGHAIERSLMSPDGKAGIIWTVSNNLSPDQWKKLFTILMEKSDEMIVPQEIKEDINRIMEGHQGDKMQAVACLEKWTQVSGGFQTQHLLEALEQLKRKDIVNTVMRHLNRLKHLSL